MKPLHVAVIGLAAFWLQVTLVPQISLFGVRPDLLLMSVVLLGMRWVHPGLYVYAALAGLALDSVSHGLLGVYGIGFLVTGALANLAGLLIYEQNTMIIMGAVAALTLAEGLVVLIVLDLMAGESHWLGWYFGAILPQAVYHAALTPLALWSVRKMSRWTQYIPYSG